MDREHILKEVENLWDIEILLGQLCKGKKKGGRGRKGRLIVTECSRSYSNSFKNYQVGKSKQNIDANEAAEPPLPPIANKKSKTWQLMFSFSTFQYLKKPVKMMGVSF